MISSIKDIDKHKLETIFSISFIAGVLAHLSYIVYCPDHADSIIFANIFKGTEYQMYSQGRWTVNLLTCIRGYLTSPILTTLITIASISFMALIIVDLFEIKKVTTALIIGISLQVHPYVANAIMYYATSGTFYYALSVLPIWIVYRIKNRYISVLISILIATICTAYSQTTMCILTALSLLMVMLQLLKGKEIKNEIGYFITNIFCSGIASVIYLVIWKIMCKVKNITYIYGGGENYNIKNTFYNLAQSIRTIYLVFLESFFGDTIIHNTYWNRTYIWLLCFVIIAVLLVFYLIHKNIPLINKTFFIIFFFLQPLAFFSIRIIVTEYEIYLMMASSLMLVLPFVFSLIESMECELKWFKVFRNLCSFLLFVIIWTYVLSDNAGYMLLNQTTNQSKSTAVRLLNRIETMDEFNYDMEVCFIGSFNKDYFVTSEELYNASPGSTFNLPGVWYGIWEVSDGWGRYIEQYCGVKLNYSSNGMQDRITQLMETEKFRNMGTFPDNSCMKIIDGTLVVKMGE